MPALLLTALLAALIQAVQPRGPVVVPPQPDPAKGRWTNHGPSGGEVWGIAVDPSDSQIAYAAVGSLYTSDEHRVGGVFKTLEGGSSWREIGPAETSFFTVAVSRSDPDRQFASSYDGLWRSVDGGVEWEKVLPGVSWPAPAALDPADVLHVWVVSDGAAWRSLDGGSTWAQMFTADAVGFDSGVPSRLHRAQVGQFGPGDNVELHFTYSDDRGETWSTASAFSNANRVRRIVSDPANPNTIYAAGDFYIFRSTDRGVTWTELPNQLGISDLAVDPRLPDTLYGTGGNFLFVSRDAGATWTEVLHEFIGSVTASAFEGATRVFAGTYRGLYSSDDLETWVDRNAGLRGAPWQTLALDPRNSSTIYSVGTEGFAASSNGGSSWSQDLMSPAAGRALAVDPSNPSRILASGWSAGIVRSRDAGATWDPIFSPGAGYTSAIVFDPVNPSIVYAADFYPLKSTDGGESWSAINHGIESIGANKIAIDSGDSELLYMSSFSSGAPTNSLFRSANAGESWVRDAGLADAGAIQTVLADPGRAGVVWLGTSSGLLRGTSSDTAWSQTGFTDSVSAVAADGSANGALYVASGLGGVFRSLDEGVTWEPMGTALPLLNVYELRADAAGGVLYAATNDGVYSLDLRRRPRVVAPR